MLKDSVPYPDGEYDKFEHSNAVSGTDCTGLITVPPEDEDELESYMDIYDFGPNVHRDVR